MGYFLFPERDVSSVIADVGVEGWERCAVEDEGIVCWVRREALSFSGIII